jgi:hypothetical protein
LLLVARSAYGEVSVKNAPRAERAAEQAASQQNPSQAPIPVPPVTSQTAKGVTSTQPQNQPGDPYGKWVAITAIVQGIAAVFVGFFTYRLVVLNAGLLTATETAANAAKDSADAAAQTLAITQRGYAKFIPRYLALGKDHALLRYGFAVDGHTPIHIFEGYLRIGIDDPPFPPNVSREPFRVALKPDTVGPKTQNFNKDAVFYVPITAEQLDAWHKNKLTVFIGGEILYRDAFPKTKAHRKYFGVKWAGTQWEPNTFIRNDEEDED